MTNSLTKIQCKGVNLIRLINLCTSKGIKLYSLCKISSTCIEFCIDNQGLKNFKNLDLTSYEIEFVEYGGKYYYKHLFLSRLGLIIGCIISVILFMFTNNKLINIKVIGLNNLDDSEIVKSVNEFGLNMFSSLDFDKKELEHYLNERFDLSLVSVITKGNTLIISIKEEIDNNITDNDAIISPYNMVIKSIKVYSGSTSLTSGSIVNKGDVLVFPYTIIDGQESYVKPCADIEADVFTVNSCTFYTQEKILQRTSNCGAINTEFYLGNLKILNFGKEVQYEQYEDEIVETNISNYFLPIKVCKKIRYQLEEVVIERNFEIEKDVLINNLLQETYGLKEKTLIVDDEKIDITKIKDGYIINIYLKSSVSLNYKD